MHDDHAQNGYSAPPPLSDADAMAILGCIECGYALAGLDQAGVCPECGAPIERSLRGNRLLFAPADYIRTLHRGLVLVLSGLAALLVIVIAWLIGLMAVTFAGIGTGMNWLTGDLLFAACGLLFFAAMLIVLAGCWLLSMPHPGFVGRDEAAGARRWLRIGAAGILLTLLMVAAMMMPVMQALPQPDLVVLLVSGLWLVFFFIALVASILLVRHLGPLADNRIIARRATLYVWLCPLLSIVGGLFCGLAPLIALVLYWNLLDLLRKELKRIRRQQAIVAAGGLIP